MPVVTLLLARQSAFGYTNMSISDFSQSAKDISFSLEGGANVPILRANLGGAPDEYSPADVNLAERIRNDNGALVFSEYTPVPMSSWDAYRVPILTIPD